MAAQAMNSVASGEINKTAEAASSECMKPATGHDIENTRRPVGSGKTRTQATETTTKTPKLATPPVRERILDAAIDLMLCGDPREISAVLANRLGTGEAYVDRALAAEAGRWRARCRCIESYLKSVGPMADADARDFLADLEAV